VADGALCFVLQSCEWSGSVSNVPCFAIMALRKEGDKTRSTQLSSTIAQEWLVFETNFGFDKFICQLCGWEKMPKPKIFAKCRSDLWRCHVM
jgi:hypothetical protein